MRDAPNDARKALKVLTDFYAGNGKRRIFNLYMTLISLQKAKDESIIDCIVKAETITALRNAGKTLDDCLLVAVALKGPLRVISHWPHSLHLQVIVTRSRNLRPS